MTDPDLLAEYERRFRREGDPWHFETSLYERQKRTATVLACGPRRDLRVLELGAANGVLAAELMPLARELTAIEAAPTAAAAARQRLAAHSAGGVLTLVVEGLIPADVPAGPYDLVVASEILYYLDDAAYAHTLEQLPEWVAPGGRLVAVHWRPAGPERPRRADDVHADLRALPGFKVRVEAPSSQYLLTALDRVR